MTMIYKQVVHIVRRERHLSTSPPSLGHIKVTNLSPFSSCCIIELWRTSDTSWSWWCQRGTGRRIRKAWRRIWHCRHLTWLRMWRHLTWLRGWRHRTWWGWQIYLLVLIPQIWIPQNSLIFWWPSPPSFFRQQVFTRKWLNMYIWTSTLRRFGDWWRDWYRLLKYQWLCGNRCSNWNWLLIKRQLRARFWFAWL